MKCWGWPQCISKLSLPFIASLLWVLICSLFTLNVFNKDYQALHSRSLSPLSKLASSCFCVLVFQAGSNTWLGCLAFPLDIFLPSPPLFLSPSPLSLAFLLLLQSQYHLPFSRLLCSHRLPCMFVKYSI